MFAARANPGGVDQEKAFSVALIEDVDRIARRAGQFADDGARIAARIELMSDDFPAFGRPTMASASGTAAALMASSVIGVGSRQERIDYFRAGPRCRGHARR